MDEIECANLLRGDFQVGDKVRLADHYVNQFPHTKEEAGHLAWHGKVIATSCVPVSRCLSHCLVLYGDTTEW